MTRGAVIKVVSTFGSQWGRIRPHETIREVFFNSASLTPAIEFSSLAIGDEVEFDEETDQVTGTHAEHVERARTEGTQVPA